MRLTMSIGLVGLLTALGVVGCTRTDPEPKKEPDAKAVADARAKHLLANEPAGVEGVKEIKQSAKDGDDVAVIGRIGGSKTPFTGRAAFTIVDTSFVPCSEKEPAEESDTPWDFC
jgi:hypothetical protein